MTTAGQTDCVAALKRAIEGHDARGLIALHAADCASSIMTIRRADSANSRASQLSPHTANACGRTMTHDIDAAIDMNQSLTFAQTCT